jgi:NTP-dependent ternary system trypsin peptidase co-occuring protein
VSVGTMPVRVGDVEVLVQTVLVAGTEPSSAVSGAGDRVVDAFAQAWQAIVEIAASTANMIGAAAERGARPDGVEVEFGLMISAKGNVIIGGVSGEATLRVKLSYERSAA